MESLKESEIAKSYKGKAFIPEKLRKIAIGSGNTRAVVFSRRITKSQGTLIGITDEIFNKWWDDNIYYSVFIDIDESSNTIKHCGIRKDNEVLKEDGGFHFVKVDVTEEELEIFQNVMEYITTNKE